MEIKVQQLVNIRDHEVLIGTNGNLYEIVDIYTNNKGLEEIVLARIAVVLP